MGNPFLSLFFPNSLKLICLTYSQNEVDTRPRSGLEKRLAPMTLVPKSPLPPAAASPRAGAEVARGGPGGAASGSTRRRAQGAPGTGPGRSSSLRPQAQRRARPRPGSPPMLRAVWGNPAAREAQFSSCTSPGWTDPSGSLRCLAASPGLPGGPADASGPRGGGGAAARRPGRGGALTMRTLAAFSSWAITSGGPSAAAIMVSLQ